MKNTSHTITTLFTSIIFIGVTIGFVSCNDAQKQKSDNKEAYSNLIFPQGDKITNANFTGTAYLKMLIQADSINPTAVGNVTFEPGARTKWHYHPAGQILLVTDGVGFYQEKGQSKKILRKGDVVKCPPNTPHWHGASDDKAFVQVAVTNNHLGATVWLDEVTDKEYHAEVRQ
jgi:quercetin dioxygenase-like cupin family protein